MLKDKFPLLFKGSLIRVFDASRNYYLETFLNIFHMLHVVLQHFKFEFQVNHFVICKYLKYFEVYYNHFLNILILKYENIIYGNYLEDKVTNGE